jgi:hypothetical protein
MSILRNGVSPARWRQIKTWLLGSQGRNERQAAFRPTLERLERRELLSAALIQPTAMNAGTPNVDIQGYTPDQIRHAYGFDKITFNNGTIPGDGRGQTIAIIESSYDQNLISDVSSFNNQWSLPQFNSQNGPTLVYDYYGQKAAVDESGSNAFESALDVEWAHAIAPEANILVMTGYVQFKADGTWQPTTSLYAAAYWAAQKSGVSVVSMSFVDTSSSNQDANGNNSDGYFQTPPGHNGVTFVAAAGDGGQFGYPASAPNVLAVGGTTFVNTLDSSGDYPQDGEQVWNDNRGSSGGGTDPNYDSNFYNPPYLKPGPNVALNATNFATYDTFGSPNDQHPSFNGNIWFPNADATETDGTSYGAPIWAALIAIADEGRAIEGLGPLDSAQTISKIESMPSSDFHTDISGSNSSNFSGSDVFGRGTPYADRVVTELMPPPTIQQPPSSPPSAPGPPTLSDDFNLLIEGFEYELAQILAMISPAYGTQAGQALAAAQSNPAWNTSFGNLFWQLGLTLAEQAIAGNHNS